MSHQIQLIGQIVNKMQQTFSEVAKMINNYHSNKSKSKDKPQDKSKDKQKDKQKQKDKNHSKDKEKKDHIKDKHKDSEKDKEKVIQNGMAKNNVKHKQPKPKNEINLIDMDSLRQQDYSFIDQKRKQQSKQQSSPAVASSREKAQRSRIRRPKPTAPSQPKQHRAPNPFLLFIKQQKQVLKQSYPNLQGPQFMETMQKLWQGLQPEQREYYVKKFEQERSQKNAQKVQKKMRKQIQIQKQRNGKSSKQEDDKKK